MDYKGFAIMTVYSLDIEVNQYYDYTAWISADNSADDPAFDMIIDAIETQRSALEACNFCGGRDILMHVYETYMETCKLVDDDPNYLEGCKVVFDAITGKGGPLQVIPERSEMYLACITEHNYALNGIDKRTNQPTTAAIAFSDLTLDSYTNIVKNAKRTYYHTAEEVSDAIKQIYEQHSYKHCRGQYRALIVIHNLSYEVNNCLKNCPIIRQLVDDGLITYLSNNATNSYKSMELNATYSYYDKRKKETVEVTYPAVYIRDTWKLTGKSIKALGDDHNYPKLPYEYECIRNVADLTQVDYDYNARDTEIALLGLYDAMSQYDATPKISLRSFPVSQNNIVSSIAKHLYAKEYAQHKHDVTADNKHVGVRHMSAEEYASYKPTTGGGLVTVNPQFAMQKFEKGHTYNNLTVVDIHHIDLNSAHPSQVFKRNFPATAPVLVSGTSKDIILDTIKKSFDDIADMCTAEGIAMDLDRFATLYNCLKDTNGVDLSGYATFELHDVKVKDFQNSGETYNIPTMWGSKIATKLSGVSFVSDDDILMSHTANKLHNKVMSADTLYITLTFEDLAICSLFYDFEIVDAHDMHVYQMRYVSPYLYKQFCHFGNKKNIYKKIVKACDKGLPYADVETLCNDTIVAAADRIAILTAYAKDQDEAVEVAERLLKVVKGQFNGIYGTAYQSLYRDKHVLTVNPATDELEWVAEEGTDGTAYDDSNNSGIDVLQGSYIAQWSRVDIAMNTMLAINCGAVPLYIATDSIYMLITTQTRSDIRDIFEGKTAAVQTGDNSCKPYNKQTAAFASDMINEPKLGGMDYENDIDEICYTQALKIIVKESGKSSPKITWSGVSASVFFAGYADVYARMLQDDGYVSRLESSKTTKIENICNEEGYVLDNVTYYNNRSDDPQYLKSKQIAIQWKTR